MVTELSTKPLQEVIEQLKAPLINVFNQRLAFHNKTACKTKINSSFKVAVACSGGQDSMLLAELSQQVLTDHFSQIELMILTVDHGLHSQSTPFAQSLVTYWSKQGLQALHLFADPKLIHQGSGLEDGARQARYAALKEAQLKYDLDLILFGHHAGDQAETILMRLQNSSGLHGLCGIPQQREWIVRPWLELSPNLIKTAFTQLDLPLYEDPSNQDPKFLRNAVRLKLSPHYKEVFGSQWQNAVVESAQHLREAADVLDYFMQDLTKTIFFDYSKIGRYKLAWPLLDQTVPQSLEKNVLRLFYSQALRTLSQKTDQRRIKEQIPFLWSLWTATHTKTLSLPHGLEAWGRHKILWIYHKGHFPSLPQAIIHIDPALWHTRQAFHVHWAEWTLSFENIPSNTASPTNDLPDQDQFMISIPHNIGQLSLRLPKQGERFAPHFLSGHKRISRLWSDRKVPLFERDRLPVLVNEQDQVIWIPYCQPHKALGEQQRAQVWSLNWRLNPKD